MNKVFLLLLISIILSNSACMTTPAEGQTNHTFSADDSTGRVVNRELTDNEMALPTGRFQYGVGINNNGLVQMPPIMIEPVLDWSYQPDNPFSAEASLVDSDGGVWVPMLGEPTSNLSDMAPYQIRRLKPDGSVDWERAYLPEGESDKPADIEQVDRDTIYTSSKPFVKPVITLNNAVILAATWTVTRAKQDQEYLSYHDTDEYKRITSGYSFMECVDFDGNTIWRSEYEDGAARSALSLRIFGDRLVNVINMEYLEIYKLADGELINTVTLDGLLSNYGQLLEAQDGSWYGVLAESRGVGVPTFFSNFNNDGTTNWITEAPEGLNWRLGLSADGILTATTRSGMFAYNTSSGDMLWNIDGYSALHYCGTAPDGNFIAFDFTENNIQSPLMSISSDGAVDWEVNIPGNTAGESNVIIFNDGSVLVGFHEGIYLLSPDGQIVWTIDFQDLGIEESGVFAMAAAWWSLNPLPDGRLVALASGWGTSGYQCYIFSLKPPG